MTSEKFPAPGYHFRIRNRHGIAAENWTDESRERLQHIAESVGAKIDPIGWAVVSDRAQLDRLVSAIGHECTSDEEPEWIKGSREHTELIELSEREPSGWCWTYRFWEHNFESGRWDSRECTYRTSTTGDGLWISLPNGDWQQLSGTLQYSLPSTRRGAKRHLTRSAIDATR